jgi:alpha-tubulin suppressor-like RCC1 family protein
VVADLGQKHYRPRPIELWESDTKAKMKGANSSGASLTEWPHPIRSIAAGETSSMAVEYDNDTEVLWAWGNVPGLWESQQLKPKEVKQLMPASRFVGTTLKATLEQELDAKKPIYKLRIPQVSCGKTHFMVLVNYNNDNNVVFTWGDTRYGKLGHGQVPEFHEQRAANRKKRRSYTHLTLHYHSIHCSNLLCCYAVELM